MAPGKVEAEGKKPLVRVSGNPSGPLRFHKQKVMVKITAPDMKKKPADLDMVAVMDISGSMGEGNKLQLMKKAMAYIIEKLNPDDRLAVVAFHSRVDSRKHLGLTKMKDSDKVVMKEAVNALTAHGGTNIKEALKEGIDILKQRDESDHKTRAACIFLMSDGEQSEGCDARTILEIPDFTVHTFGFGVGHDELVLAEIADRSISGVYSNVPDDKLMLAMGQQLALSRSMTALDVKVKLTPVNPAPEDPPTTDLTKKKTEGQEVGSISVDAGDYMVTDGQDSKKRCGSRVIRFGDLACDEVRRIIVDMPFHGITAPIMTLDKVLKVECFYRLPHEKPGDRPATVHVELELVREQVADQYKMKPDVKLELLRRQQAEYLRMVKVWTDKGPDDLPRAIDEAKRAREALGVHFEIKSNTKLKKELYAELNNLDDLLAIASTEKPAEYIKLCRAYLLACLSSHGRQRFAGRGGKQEEDPFYLTPSMKKCIPDIMSRI